MTLCNQHSACGTTQGLLVAMIAREARPQSLRLKQQSPPEATNLPVSFAAAPVRHREHSPDCRHYSPVRSNVIGTKGPPIKTIGDVVCSARAMELTGGILPPCRSSLQPGRRFRLRFACPQLRVLAEQPPREVKAFDRFIHAHGVEPGSIVLCETGGTAAGSVRSDCCASSPALCSAGEPALQGPCTTIKASSVH